MHLLFLSVLNSLKVHLLKITVSTICWHMRNENVPSRVLRKSHRGTAHLGFRIKASLTS